MLGHSSIGEIALGEGSRGICKTQFNLEQKVEEEKPIIMVSSLFNQKLVEHFIQKPEEMKRMDRRKFEELVAELFDGFGYDVELTQKTRDGGKDIIAICNKKLISSKYLIECKRPEPGKKIGVGVVRELMGVKVDDKATQAIAVTTAYFSQEAHEFQKRNQWELELKEYNDLAQWLKDYARIKG